MKISSSVFLVSSLYCLGTAVSQKSTKGLRGLTQDVETECLRHFDELDIDKDDVLSLQDLKAVVDYMVDTGVDVYEVKTLAHDLSDADYNDDGQIDKQEFMMACDGKEKENVWDKAKKDLAMKFAPPSEEKKDSYTSIGQKVKALQRAHEAQEEESAGFPHEHEAQEDEPTCEEIFNDCANGDDTMTAAEYETCITGMELIPSEQVAEFVANFTATFPDGATVEDSCYPGSTKKTKEATKEAEMDDDREAALKECTVFFERMDIDKDGELSLEDLETVVDSKVKANVADTKIREFVDAMGNLDLNNDDVIDYEEYMSACLKN